MTSKDPDFSVIVVAYNSGGVLSRCMDALARQTFGNFEVLLVDNGSDDGPIEKPDLLGDRTRVLRPGKNLGFAAGNNLAARSAAAKWLWSIRARSTTRILRPWKRRSRARRSAIF